MSAAPSRVHVVNDHDSSTRDVHASTFTNLTQSRVGVWARPDTRRMSPLATDILTSFGVQDGLAGNGRPGEGHLARVVAWAKAYDIDDLYVQNAFLLPLPVITELLATTISAGWHVWLVGDTGYRTTVQDTVDDFCRNHRLPPADVVDASQFLDTFKTALTEPDPIEDAVPVVDWPEHVPSDDFTTFRAACRDLMEPPVFEVVDEFFVRHARAAADVAKTLPRDTVAREQAMADWFHARWREVETVTQFVVVVRAAQVGLFASQLHLRVELDRLVGTAQTMPHDALRRPHAWRRLRAYADPARGAACAFAAAGVPLGHMATLLIGDVAADGSTARTGAGDYDIFEPARPFVRAQHRLRTDEGAGPDDVFFEGQNQNKTDQRLARFLTEARREAGVAVAASYKERDLSSGSRWLTRWGLSIRELT